MTNPLVLRSKYNKLPIKSDGGVADVDWLTREHGKIESALAFATSLASTVGNVLDYGADPRGIRDSTFAITQAIAENVAVLIPVGTYRVDGPVTVASRVAIRIDGTIALSGYAYGPNPPTAFLVTADGVVFHGAGTLRGPGQYSHDTVTDTADIPSLIRVRGADRVTVTGLTFEDVPQAGLVYTDADECAVVGNWFIGGDTVAACVAGINYYAIAGYDSDALRIVGNTFTDDADGHTFAEGIFLYGTNDTLIAGNTAHNIVDHDVYLYHSVGDITGVNNRNIVTDNVSTTTLTGGTQKIGSSYKAHGLYNQITNNTITNTFSGVTLEGGAYSTVAGNAIQGFTTQAIVVSDLVSPNALGLNYISVEGNTLYGAATGTPSGVYFRGDATYSTANAVGGRIVGNTIIRCGDPGGSNPSPIELFHSNASYVMTGFTVTGNVIVGQTGEQGIYLDRVAASDVSGNIIRDGTYADWRGVQVVANVTDLTLMDNTITDAGSALGYGVVVTASNQTGWRVMGNVVRNASIFGAVFVSPATTMAAYRDNDWETVANEPIPPTVASAASITLPVGWDVANVSGTTNITSIDAAGQSNHRVTLVFAGVLTVVDGSNLLLNGSYTTAADTTLTLVCDGTDWYEVGRSAPSVPVGTITTVTTTATATGTTLGDATSAAFSVNLPAASGVTGQVFTIKKIDASANAVTVDAAGGDLIDGAGTYPLAAQWESITVQSNGTNWYIL